MTVRVEVMNSADERKDHEPKNEHDLEAGKAREMTISETSEDAWPCQHLNFAPVKPTADF